MSKEPEQKIIQLPAIVTRVSSLADGGLSIGLHTNELSPEEKVEVMKLHGIFGFACFKPNEFKPEEIPKGDADFEIKSLSERLRSSLFVLHTKRGGKPENFEDFRRKYMEKRIEEVKTKINEFELEEHEHDV